MPLTVLSPHSGRPVKVRTEDLGRAVRDEGGRVFYVVPRANGEGYYAALTRKGSEKDEQRYDKLERRTDEVQEQVDQQAAAVHDATGRRRSRPLLRLLTLLILLGILVTAGYFAWQWWNQTQPDLPAAGSPEVLPDLPDLPTPQLPDPPTTPDLSAFKVDMEVVPAECGLTQRRVTARIAA